MLKEGKELPGGHKEENYYLYLIMELADGSLESEIE